MRRLLRAVLLIVVGGVVAAAAVVLDARPAEPCARAPLTLRVAAAPDIAPAVRRVAAPFTRERHAVAGRCVTVAVTARTGADVASGLASGRSGTDAWVTDASAWAGDVRRARGAAFLPEGPVIAVSPLVFAVRRDGAARVRRTRPGWHSMITTAFDPHGHPQGAAFTPAVPDPTRSANGIATLSALHAAAGPGASDPGASDPGTPDPDAADPGGPDPGDPGTGTPGPARLDGAATRLAATFAALPTAPVPAVPGGATASPVLAAGTSGLPVVATEQEVWAGVRGGAKAAAVYPADGSPSVAYRYLVSSADRRVRRAAWALGARLLSARGVRAFTAAGFRAPSGGPSGGASGSPSGGGSGSPGGGPAGFAAEDGLDPGPVVALEVSEGPDELRLRRMWARRHAGVRLLVVLDASPSMATPPRPGAPDRRAAAAAGVRTWPSTLSPRDEAGLWTYTAGPTPARQAAPVRPLTAPQRATLTAALPAATSLPAAPSATAAPGGLYAVVLAAYERARRGYRPGRYNGVIVVTGGRDTRAGPSRARTLRALAAAYDPRRPVDLGIVAFGPDTDEPAVRALAAAAHGTAWTSAGTARAPALLAAVPPHLACASWCP